MSLKSCLTIDYRLLYYLRQRLHFLKNYWMERVKEVPDVYFKTSLDPRYGCAIGVFGIEGKKATDISSRLFDKWKIHTVAIEREAKPGIEAAFNHVRVTPNVYTTTQELDRLVEAIGAIRRLDDQKVR